MRLKSILCPIDFSEFSGVAFQHALSLAGCYKARIVALHVVELWKSPFADYAAQESDYAKFSRALSEGGEVQLQQFVKEQAAGALQPEILRHATETQASLIIMTARGGDAVDRAVFGSTRYRVIQFGSCPVLAVHT